MSNKIKLPFCRIINLNFCMQIFFRSSESAVFTKQLALVSPSLLEQINAFYRKVLRALVTFSFLILYVLSRIECAKYWKPIQVAVFFVRQSLLIIWVGSIKVVNPANKWCLRLRTSSNRTWIPPIQMLVEFPHDP